MLFSQFVIVGTGLLGTSIGLAVRERKLAETLIGVDCSRRNLEAAQGRLLFDRVHTEVEAIEPVDDVVVVVCAPVSVLSDIVRRTLKHWNANNDVLITDVGSTKASLCRAIDDPRFLGSHPIAGSEQSGPAAATANLFEQRTTILTPTSRHSDQDVAKLTQFWAALGSLAVTMTPEQHDAIVAVTSHLPHLLSVVLASTVLESERPFTGSGFAGMTRLAAGSPSLWRDILLDNSDHVLAAVQRFEQRLSELKSLLGAKDEQGVEKFLSDALA